MKRFLSVVITFTIVAVLVSCKNEDMEEDKNNKNESLTCSVIFDSKGGSLVGSLTVLEGEKVDKPNDPLMEGYNFIGWEFEGELYNFNNVITKNITLTAKWEKEIIIDGTYIFTSSELWEIRDKNSSTNLILSEETISLEDNELVGIYESVPIKSKRFNELVLSFNAKDLSSGSIVLMVSVGNNNDFSEYYFMGRWLNGKYSSTSGQSDDFGRVSIDTFVNKDLDNEYVKLKFVINPGQETKVKNITVTTKKENEELLYDESLLINKVLNVPKIAQLSIPVIGNSICSPTSVAMVLNYYGINESAEHVSEKVYDHGASIYGNWTFNASYAGSKDGLVGYVSYINDFSDVINYIKNDIPVVFSIKTNSISDLEGSIMGYPAGHLIVLVGFEKIENKWYGVFNDPAEYDDNKVLRKYSMDQVLEAWKLYTYIIKEE